MKSRQFDAAFERDEDVTGSLDLAMARRPRLQQRTSPSFADTGCLLLADGESGPAGM